MERHDLETSLERGKSAEYMSAKSPGMIPESEYLAGDSLYARMQRLATKLKIEQRGVERVPEDERTDTSLLNVGSMWLSANLCISSFAIGVLGKSLFGLGVIDGMLVVIIANMVGIIPVCYFSCFGAVFGLRQMIISRFWFGMHGAKFIAIFNVCACIGWSAVNSIVGAQMLNAVSDDIPGWGGILIIAVSTFIVTLFGYRVIHAYNFWAWIPCFIVFMIIMVQFIASDAFINIPMGTGTSEVGGVLSFAAVVYGFATGWSSYSADYTVYQPANQSKAKIFFATYIGLILPLLFTQLLGVAVMTATGIDDDPETNPYLKGYSQSGTGGLIAAVLVPPMGGFGRFCLIIMALSIIANNCPNIYSVGLTLQVFGDWTQRVPRFIWTFIGTVVYIAIAIPGYSYFEEVLDNFMNFIAYWLAIYAAIALTEHLYFRHGFGGYNPDDHADASKLPKGYAAMFAFCCGMVAVAMGMSQTWFVGPLARLCGEAPTGGDIAIELAWGVSVLTYLVARTLEIRHLNE